MNTSKLISFDLKAEFGFFKKPDINATYLTYNMLHKPALLGILGSICGFSGFQKNGELPEYYTKLKDLPVAIKPIETENGNFNKFFLKYSNGTGFANKAEGGILLVTEQILINPSFRCFLLLDKENPVMQDLYLKLKKGEAVYLPYMGKNDFSAWWDNFLEYDDFSSFEFDRDYTIDSIFAKTETVTSHLVKAVGRKARRGKPVYFNFEKLPVGYNEELYQYQYENFVYSPNAVFSSDMKIEKGQFLCIDSESIIQLF